MLKIILFIALSLLRPGVDGVDCHVPKSRQCHKPCPRIYSPVCGFPVEPSSGEPKTFGNNCELHNYNCDNKQNSYIFSYDGKCKKNCNNVCIAKHDPVCAKPVGFHGAPKQFGNECELERYNCHHPGRQYKLSHNGPCHRKH